MIGRAAPALALAFALTMAALFSPGLSRAQAGAGNDAPPGPFAGFKSSGDEPVEVSAARMKADLKTGKLVFTGRVTARQGKRVIYAERMDIDFTDKGDVTLLVATGNVKVRMEDSFATSDRLTLDNIKKTITLTGKPRVVQGDQIVVGKVITYYMEQERIRVNDPRIELTPEGNPASPKKPGNEADAGDAGNK